MQTIPATIPQHQRRLAVKLTPKMERFVDCLVLDAMDVKQAALASGIRVKRANWLLTVPAVNRAYRQRMQVLRESAAARGIHVAAAIMERGLDVAATAATAKAALDAARFLEGESGRAGGTTVSVSVTNQVVGYVMDLREEGEVIANQRAVAANPLIEHDPVGSSDE